MAQNQVNSEQINSQYRPRAPVLPEDKFLDTDDFCFYKVQRLPMKVSNNHEVTNAADHSKCQALL